MTTKAILRAHYRELERNRPADEVAAASKAIFKQLAALEVFQQAHCIGAYLSLPAEVQSREIIEACWENGVDVCVPYYLAAERFYGMSKLHPGAPVRTQRWNVSEPENPEPVDPAMLDLILVPAMAFDGHGNRLGHGGGHYDRLLAQVKGYRLGLAFHEQLADELPREPHDQPVQAVLTERKLLEVIP